MIKVKTENGGVEIEVEGTSVALTADTLVIIEAVHELLEKHDDADAALYVNSIVAMMTAPDLPFQAKNPMADEVERLKKQEAAMTAHIRKHTDPDHLCLMCRYRAECSDEAENEDDKTTRFWRCKHGEEFQYKEVD